MISGQELPGERGDRLVRGILSPCPNITGTQDSDSARRVTAGCLHRGVQRDGVGVGGGG